jgi:hypothetical protein
MQFLDFYRTAVYRTIFMSHQFVSGSCALTRNERGVADRLEPDLADHLHLGLRRAIAGLRLRLAAALLQWGRAGLQRVVVADVLEGDLARLPGVNVLKQFRPKF